VDSNAAIVVLKVEIGKAPEWGKDLFWYVDRTQGLTGIQLIRAVNIDFVNRHILSTTSRIWYLERETAHNI
jgi:hypothetical protein